MTMTMTVSV